MGDILVVDDADENLLAIEAALGDLGAELVMARSGEEALRRLLERDFALILLDVRMPDMDGLEAASLIRGRSRNRHIPIIFVTAYDQNDDVVLEAYRLGAVDFLFKPINTEVLRAKASMFVELQLRNAEVARQSHELAEKERLMREQALAEQRRRLEAQALRERLSEQNRHAEILTQKNDELEKAYAELKRVNRRLEADDRRKDEFIAVLGHELRNPLVPIVTGLDLLDRKASGISPDDVLATMTRQVDHLTRLVDDLLDVSRIAQGKIELRKVNVAIKEIVARACEISAPSIEGGGHSLEVELGTVGDRSLHGDPVRLAQVVSNLLNNASRYTPAGGRIALTCTAEDSDVLITVADSGQGMDEDLLEHVFDMFVQAAKGGGGLGLGLTIVKRMVTLHGGQVSARSAGIGHGSEFIVRLPLLPAHEAASTTPFPAAPAADPPRNGSALPFTPLRIALVEDNEDIQEMMRLLVESWGHDLVGEAGTVADGVELILGTRPHVALVDLGLPDGTGFDVARRVRAELSASDVHLIAVSGFGQAKDRADATEAGFDQHLCKPVHSDELLRAIGRAFE